MADLKKLRQELDKQNAGIVSKIAKRMEIVKEVAEYKKQNNIPIVDAKREEEVIKHFEDAFEKIGFSRKVGKIIGRALIDAAIEEEKRFYAIAR